MKLGDVENLRNWPITTRDKTIIFAALRQSSNGSHIFAAQAVFDAHARRDSRTWPVR
jgi:hypothetical protein